MDKLGSTGKIIVAVIIVAVLVVLAFLYGSNRGQNQGNAPSVSGLYGSTTSPTQTSGQTSTQARTPAKTNTYVAPRAPAPPAITFITPAAGDTWHIGKQNTVAWSKAANSPGEIALLDAKTRALVGVILPQTGPNQTSYTWSTINISLSRTNPSGKDVVPGTYVIQISFDITGIPTITSPAFTIAN